MRSGYRDIIDLYHLENLFVAHLPSPLPYVSVCPSCTMWNKHRVWNILVFTTISLAGE